MKLFTVGPVQMFDDTLHIASKQIPYFRTSEFSNIMFNIEKNIKKIMFTEENAKVALLTTSGTGAMEAVVSSAFDENDRLLIINGGSFGKRFCDLSQIYDIKYDEIKLDFEEKLTEKHFEKIDGSKYSAILVNIHETSTGQLYDINIIKNFANRYNLFLIVDAISSFLADEYKMDEFGIDCTIISSQKALSLSPGISMVVMNEKFYKEKIENKKKKRTLYLDLNEHIENMKRGQTPFTPAVGIILELNERLKQICQYGVTNIVQETNEKAMYFRKLVSERLPNVKILDYNLSNTLTPIWFEDNNAYEVFEKLKKDYDIFVTPSGGELTKNLLRIGHIRKFEKK